MKLHNLITDYSAQDLVRDKENKKMTQTAELHEFVINQAAEDAVLAPSERKWQAEIVLDVLEHEAPSRLVQTLKDEYFGQIALARE